MRISAEMSHYELKESILSVFESRARESLGYSVARYVGQTYHLFSEFVGPIKIITSTAGVHQIPGQDTAMTFE